MKRPVISLVALIVFSLAAIPNLRAAGPTFGRPALLTSAGQSPDIAILKVLFNTQLKMGFDYKPLAQPADLAGVKTLIVTLGVSTKGLGAAGLDVEKEVARASALMKAAKAHGIKVIAMHVGGEARRGKTSNDVINVVVPECDYAVVVASGNKDGLFNQLTARRNTPLVQVEKMAAAGDAIKAVFQQP